MTDYPRGVGTGGAGTSPSIAAREETSRGSGMRSPRGVLGSLALLLALPIAVLTQVLFGGGSAVAIHVALAAGCGVLFLSPLAFRQPGGVGGARGASPRGSSV